jgi:hypothetical protein
MRVSTTALFQGLDGLRRTVDELQDALVRSNDKVVMLAKRVKVLEEELARVIIAQLNDEALGGTNAVEAKGRNEVYQEGDEQGSEAPIR